MVSGTTSAAQSGAVGSAVRRGSVGFPARSRISQRDVRLAEVSRRTAVTSSRGSLIESLRIIWLRQRYYPDFDATLAARRSGDVFEAIVAGTEREKQRAALAARPTDATVDLTDTGT